MEDTLREREFFGHPFTFKSLNPCFNGRYSQSGQLFEIAIQEWVLILVLMEDTLRGKDADVKNFDKGLNPCFNGRYSQRRLKQPYLEQGGLNPCFNGRYSQRL